MSSFSCHGISNVNMFMSTKQSGSCPFFILFKLMRLCSVVIESNPVMQTSWWLLWIPKVALILNFNSYISRNKYMRQYNMYFSKMKPLLKILLKQWGSFSFMVYVHANDAELFKHFIFALCKRILMRLWWFFAML